MILTGPFRKSSLELMDLTTIINQCFFLKLNQKLRRQKSSACAHSQGIRHSYCHLWWIALEKLRASQETSLSRKIKTHLAAKVLFQECLKKDETY